MWSATAGNGYQNDATELVLSVQSTSNSDDLAADYSTASNPNGAWTYGWEPSLGGTFGNDTHTGDFVSGVDEYASPIQYLSIWHNRTANTITTGPVTFAPGKVVLHPGPSGQYSVVRWTAPAAASYQISSTFSGIDSTPTTTDVHVLHNNSGLFTATLNLSSGSNTATYTNMVTLAAGDTLDFAVGNGGNGYGDDATQLDVTIGSSGSGSGSGGTGNLSADFSTVFNPSHGWAYGSSPSNDTTLFTLDMAADDLTEGVDQYVSPVQYMSIWHNRTSSEIDFATIMFAPGQVVLHPGPSGEHSMVRWTAPTTGPYDVNAAFTGVDSFGTTSDVSVFLGTNLLYSSTVDPSTSNNPTYSSVVSLLAGEDLFFTVGNGLNGNYYNDATQLSVTIQPSGVCTQLPVVLGAAGDFAVLAGSTVTSTGPTMVNGDLGVSPGTAIVGFPPGIVVGDQHSGDPASAQGIFDLTTAYNDAAGRTLCPVSVAGNLGGSTLAPGLYKSTSSLSISSGDLTLDAQGNSDGIFIFQMASTLTTTSGRQVILAGGAKASNVFWQVGTSATLGSTSAFSGTILADQSITLETGVTLDGRALARIAAVSLDNDSVIKPAP